MAMKNLPGRKINITNLRRSFGRVIQTFEIYELFGYRNYNPLLFTNRYKFLYGIRFHKIELWKID